MGDKQIIQISDILIKQMGMIDDIDFDVFEYYNKSENKGLSYMLLYILRREKIDEYLGISQKMILEVGGKIESGYRDENTYHNAIHACDVLQTTNYFIKGC